MSKLERYGEAILEYRSEVSAYVQVPIRRVADLMILKSLIGLERILTNSGKY
jgi:hypothetical protein